MANQYLMSTMPAVGIACQTCNHFCWTRRSKACLTNKCVVATQQAQLRNPMSLLAITAVWLSAGSDLGLCTVLDCGPKTQVWVRHLASPSQWETWRLKFQEQLQRPARRGSAQSALSKSGLNLLQMWAWGSTCSLGCWSNYHNSGKSTVKRLFSQQSYYGSLKRPSSELFSG